MKTKLPAINLILVFVGGAFGGLFRYALTQVPGIGNTPWMTLFINFVGTAGLAALAVILERRRVNPERLQPLVGVGLMGGFTTFGALIAESHEMVAEGQLALAVLLLAVSLLLGFVAVFIGRKLASYVPQKKQGEVAS